MWHPDPGTSVFVDLSGRGPSLHGRTKNVPGVRPWTKSAVCGAMRSLSQASGPWDCGVPSIHLDGGVPSGPTSDPPCPARAVQSASRPRAKYATCNANHAFKVGGEVDFRAIGVGVGGVVGGERRKSPVSLHRSPTSRCLGSPA